MQETVNQETATVEQSANAEQSAATEKMFTQDEVNKIINKRFAEFKTLQEKAKKFDEIEEANKTELQKASEKVSALQDELNAIKKANEIRDIRSEVAKKMNIPADLLTAETAEECEAQAKAIQEFASAQSGYPQLKDNGEVPKVAGGSTRQQFADWLNSNY